MTVNSSSPKKESALKIIEANRIDYSPLYILEGSDLYLKNAVLEIIRNSVLDPGFVDFNYTKIECSSSTKSSELIDALHELPMLTDKRLLEIHNPEKLTASIGKQIVGELQDTAKVGENIVCIVYGDNVKEDKSGLKRSLSTVSLLVNCAVYPADIPKWIDIFCKKKGGSIQRAAVNELQERCGLDIMQLSSQLDKLFLYVGDRQINLQDVKIAVNKSLDVKIWDYTNALTNKNVRAALDSTNLLLEEDPQRGALTLLSYLNVYLRSMAQINSLVKLYGQNISLISKAIPQKREYQIRRNMEEAKAWPDTQLELAFREIYKTDYLLKSGQDPLLTVQRLTLLLIQR